MRDSLSKVNDAVYLDDESKFFAALDSSQVTSDMNYILNGLVAASFA